VPHKAANVRHWHPAGATENAGQRAQVSDFPL